MVNCTPNITQVLVKEHEEEQNIGTFAVPFIGKDYHLFVRSFIPTGEILLIVSCFRRMHISCRRRHSLNKQSHAFVFLLMRIRKAPLPKVQ